MGRLTDNDHRFGILTYGKSHSPWRNFRLAWRSSGDNHDDFEHDPKHNVITGDLFGWIFSIRMPNIIKPHCIKHTPEWDQATIDRLGRNYFYEYVRREYGFSVFEGHFVLRFGTQTDDSRSTKSWSCFLPWTEWRHIRHNYYDRFGRVFGPNQAKIKDYDWSFADTVPKVVFNIDDYDNERVTATTYIEEREWKFGTGWFKWLSLFRKNMVRRSLNISFSSEVGKKKGSYKGGTIGHSIDMLPRELHETAMKRYCEKHEMTFMGEKR